MSIQDKIKNMAGEKTPKIRKMLILFGCGACLFAASIIWNSLSWVSTDDAFIEGHVIPISARVSSHVEQVHMMDNQEVKQGDLLVELDSRDFDVRLQIAKASLMAAESEAREAKRDVERYTVLSKTDEVSRQQLDKATLRMEMAEARLSEAKAQVEQAELQVSYTKIKAPESGYITRKSVEPGAFIQAGQALFAIVGKQNWVVANFKETQLTHMKAGQDVVIKIDTYPGKEFKGHVDSIQRGTGARFSLFPPENATGNFVKVVQRVPVKIVFDEEPGQAYPLAIGMSVVPEVKVRG